MFFIIKINICYKAYVVHYIYRKIKQFQILFSPPNPKQKFSGTCLKIIISIHVMYTYKEDRSKDTLPR